MKSIIKRLFWAAEPTPAREAAHSAMSSELGTSDIESYFLSLIRDCLGRMLVSPDTIRVDVWRSGANARGQPMFAGYVRILKWDPVLTPVLLQTIPVIAGRVRRPLVPGHECDRKCTHYAFRRAGGNRPPAHGRPLIHPGLVVKQEVCAALSAREAGRVRHHPLRL